MRNSTIVVRSGDSRKEHDLEKVAVQAARKVIIVSKPGVSREEADVITLTSLMTLRSHAWPNNGTCVVQCQLVRNQELFSDMVKAGSNVLTSADFVSELLVQCSQQHGLAEVVRSVFCFDGDEFYVEPIKGIKGRTFMEVLFALPRVIMIGIVTSSGQVELLPAMDRRFEGDERLVVLAEDDSDIPGEATLRTLEQSVKPSLLSWEKSQGLKPLSPKRQTVVIVGWNEMIGAMLVELDKIVAFGSTLIIHSPVDKKVREEFIYKAQRRRKHDCNNLTICHSEGPLAARFLLEELPLARADTIFVLAEKLDDLSADAQTLAVSVQIQDILMRGPKNDTVSHMIMPELLEADSQDLAVKSGISDYMLTDQLIARITAYVAEVPQLSCILDCIVKDRSCSFCIRELQEYPAATTLDLDNGITFDEVLAVAACANDVVLGWSCPDPSEGVWEMNPKIRGQKRSWHEDARLVVLQNVKPSDPSADNSPVNTKLLVN